MTDQLSDISARIDGIRQLGTVVSAIKGIAAARVRNALMQVAAVETYSDIIADAMSRTLTTEQANDPFQAQNSSSGKTGMLVFGAEQGFAGPFTERVLDSITDDPQTTDMLFVGTRGMSIAKTRGLSPIWNAALPANAASIPKLANDISQVILTLLDNGQLTRLDVIYPASKSGTLRVLRKGLFPLDLSVFSSKSSAETLIQLPRTQLLGSLGAEYLHALICRSALHAFAAENQARMVAMSSAHSQIKAELEVYQATQRRVRQEAITAEIIELGAGVEAGVEAGAHTGKSSKHAS